MREMMTVFLLPTPPVTLIASLLLIPIKLSVPLGVGIVTLPPGRTVLVPALTEIQVVLLPIETIAFPIMLFPPGPLLQLHPLNNLLSTILAFLVRKPLTTPIILRTT